jgi:hypothetical protein
MIASIIGWVIVGGILGALARLIVPGRDPMSTTATTGLGIAGELVADLLRAVRPRCRLDRRPARHHRAAARLPEDGDRAPVAPQLAPLSRR